MQQTIVYAITAGSLFLLSLVTLATPRNVNIRANCWLAFFLFSFGCIALDRVLFDTHVYSDFPVLEGVLEVTRFALTPALYFSVLYFTVPDRRVRAYDYFHFVPFFLFFLFVVILAAGIDNSFLFRWYDYLAEDVKRGIAVTVFSSLKVQMIVYWLLSYVRLLKHLRNIRLFASNLTPVSLTWLRYFLFGLAGALVLSLNDVVHIIPAVVPFTHFAYLILTFYLGYFSLRQHEIFPYQSKERLEIKEILEVQSRTSRHQRLVSSELNRAIEKLTDIMKVEKAYLDPGIGLPQLAAKMNMSTHDLSFVINEGFQENFFQFINRYRIDEAKRLLKSASHKHLNILGIAYESGFRSKSTFNDTFKKLTGQSPSQFMKSGHVPVHHADTEKPLKEVRLDNSGRVDEV